MHLLYIKALSSSFGCLPMTLCTKSRALVLTCNLRTILLTLISHPSCVVSYYFVDLDLCFAFTEQLALSEADGEPRWGSPLDSIMFECFIWNRFSQKESRNAQCRDEYVASRREWCTLIHCLSPQTTAVYPRKGLLRRKHVRFALRCSMMRPSP